MNEVIKASLITGADYGTDKSDIKSVLMESWRTGLAGNAGKICTIVFYAVYVRDRGDPIIPRPRLNQGPFNPAGYPNWDLGLNTNSLLLPYTFV